MKFKKDKKTTVVPVEKKGAENVITKKKFSFKGVIKNIGKGIKNGFGAVANFAKSHKKISIGTLAVVVVAVIAVILIPTFSLNSAEKGMKNKLNDLGVTFYEDFYYKSAGNGDEAKRKEFLAKYETLGIKVSLENLARYYVTTEKYKESDIAKMDDSVTDRVNGLIEAWFKNDKYNCDGANTKVVIYPKDPFGEKDYKIEVITSCGFKSEGTEEKTTTVKKASTDTTTTKKEETTTKATTTKAATTKKTTKKKN